MARADTQSPLPVRRLTTTSTKVSPGNETSCTDNGLSMLVSFLNHTVGPTSGLGYNY